MLIYFSHLDMDKYIFGRLKPIESYIIVAIIIRQKIKQHKFFRLKHRIMIDLSESIFDIQIHFRWIEVCGFELMIYDQIRIVNDVFPLQAH